jgi:recombination protein RecR
MLHTPQAHDWPRRNETNLRTHPTGALSIPKNERSADPVQRLIFELAKLPGVGEKTAARLAYFILKQDLSYARSLAQALLQAKEQTELCKQCFTFTHQEFCSTCSNPNRDLSLLCIVERPADVLSIEQAGIYHGLYHVLHGVLSPLSGVGPEELKIEPLLERLRNGSISEIILATNPSVEGEATCLYLSKMIKPFGIRITKLAHGIPVGGLLEYTDRQTLGKALENRVEIN